MTAEVKILIEGYTNSDVSTKIGEEKTQPTVTLVKDKNIVMVVDPGVLDSQQVLIKKLKNEGLEIEDVNYIFITHSHLDHYRNVGMFENAKVIEYFGVWDKNKVKDRVENLTENIRILLTPGHDYTSLTLFVNTEQGVVAICGDVFWKEGRPEIDPYAQDLNKLEQSRKLVLDTANFIIPGHGPMYKVKKSIRENHIIPMDSINKIFSMNIFSVIKEKINPKKNGKCKKCKSYFTKLEDKCTCQPQICFRCCECDVDCDLCNCKHKIK